jgi:hypothetical protein
MMFSYFFIIRHGTRPVPHAVSVYMTKPIQSLSGKNFQMT